MAHVDPEVLENPERVFIAARLREALRVEEMLTGEGVDYAVQVEPFGTSLFFSQRNGAAFYVASDQADFCRSRLVAQGLSRGVVHHQD